MHDQCTILLLKVQNDNLRMQIIRMNMSDYFSNVETILTAIEFIRSIVTILHAIAMSVRVDTLSISAYEFGRRASYAQKEDTNYYK